jgi:hypothetical protein
LEALKMVQQLRVCQSALHRDIALPTWSMGNFTDHLEESAAHGWGCQPVLIGDLADLPHAGAAPVELTQDRLSQPGRDTLKRKGLIYLHGTSYELTISSNRQLITLADEGQDTGFLWSLGSHPPLGHWEE